MILSIGEILVDMIGVQKDGSFYYERKAGGAPFNVACAVNKLGGDSAFVGSVGDDTVGKFLIGFADAQGLRNYIQRCGRNTTLAFVDLDENGERDFCFYRKNTADYHLPEVPDELFEKATIVHVGSLMLSEKEGLEYARAIIKRAHAAGKIVSFDVNFRSDIFRDKETAVKTYKEFVDAADIIKFSEEEAELFGADNYGTEKDGKLVCITCGGKGSIAGYRGKKYHIGSIKVKPIDTTGAGDAFFGGLLCMLDGKSDYDEALIEHAFSVANVCGALNTQSRGAIDGLPAMADVNAALQKR